MVQELIRLSQSWSETRWIYLQQNLTIPRSSNMTILDFFNGGLSRTELVTAQEVCQWAKRLQLEKSSMFAQFTVHLKNLRRRSEPYFNFAASIARSYW